MIDFSGLEISTKESIYKVFLFFLFFFFFWGNIDLFNYLRELGQVILRETPLSLSWFMKWSLDPLIESKEEEETKKKDSDFEMVTVIYDWNDSSEIDAISGTHC